MNNEEIKKKLSKKQMLFIIIAAIIVIVGVIFLIIKITDKTVYYKNVINTSFNKITTSINELDKITGNNTSFSDSIIVNGDIQDNTSKVGIELKTNLKDKILQGRINYNTYDLNYIYQDNKSYISSDSIFNNTYQIDGRLGSIDLDSILSNITIESNADTAELINTINSLKAIITSSLENKYISKKTTKTIIDKTEESVTRYSYTLNKESLKKFLDKLNKNNNLKKKIINLVNTIAKDEVLTESNFRSELESKIINGTFNIYTQGSKVRKVSIYLVDFLNVDFTSNNGYDRVEFTNEKKSNNVIVNYNTNSKEYTISLFQKSSKRFDITFMMDNDINASYSVYTNNDKITGTITVTDVMNIKNRKIKATINYNNKTFTINCTINKNDSVSKMDVSNAITNGTPSEEEQLKFKNAISEFTNSSLFKDLSSLVLNLIGNNN
ncbi:MAG: hypothetical protein PUD34_05110 [bacterium]|nr:hypothetical protein [bacterium]